MNWCFAQPQVFNNFKGGLPKPPTTPQPAAGDRDSNMLLHNDKERLNAKEWLKVEEIEDYRNLKDEVQEDLLRLDVYFQSMTATNIVEEPKFTASGCCDPKACVSWNWILLSDFWAFVKPRWRTFSRDGNFSGRVIRIHWVNHWHLCFQSISV